MMLMNYNELYEILKENFDKEGNFKTIEDLNVTIETIHFHSKKADLLNGSFSTTSCEKHQTHFKESNENQTLYGFSSIDVKDFDIERNKHFEYYILKRADVEIAEGTLIFSMD